MSEFWPATTQQGHVVLCYDYRPQALSVLRLVETPHTFYIDAWRSHWAPSWRAMRRITKPHGREDRMREAAIQMFRLMSWCLHQQRVEGKQCS